MSPRFPKAPRKPEEPAKPTNPTYQGFADVKASDWFYGDVVWAYTAQLMIGVSDNMFAPHTLISQGMVVTTLARMSGVDLSKYESSSKQKDIEPGQWYSSAALWARESGILTDEVFHGDKPLERGQFARILCNYLKYAGVKVTVPAQPVEFADADQMTAEENEAFQILYQYGIFNGVGNHRMDVKGSASRAQLAALLHRLSVFISLQK